MRFFLYVLAGIVFAFLATAGKMISGGYLGAIFGGAIGMLIAGAILKSKEAKEMEETAEEKEEHKHKQMQNLKETKERQKYLKSLHTWNPITMAKYRKILTTVKNKFIDIYDFQTPAEYKNIDLETNLAFALFFEEARENRLSVFEFTKLLYTLYGENQFQLLIKPIDDEIYDFELHSNMYSAYIDFRAKKIRPIVSTLAVIQISKGNEVTKEYIEKLKVEYENNPMLGDSV